MSYGDNPEGVDLYYGDLLVDFFDEQNNMVNPPSDVGFFLYNLFGKAFDDAMESINQMLLNTDPLTCELPFLDIIAQDYKLKRKQEWNDAKWRAVIISYHYNLETIAGIEYILNQISNYYNREEGVEREKIIVDYFIQYADGFVCSDKYDSYDQCSDKYDTLTTLGTVGGEKIIIDYKNNPVNEVMEQLMGIIEKGGV